MKKQDMFLTGALFVCACTLLAAHITTDYDHFANFANYKTYSWLSVKAGDQLWEERIQQDVDQQLTAKGWTKVDSNASAVVAAFESTKDQRTLQTFYDGLGGGWGWRRFGGGGFGGDGLATTTTEITKVGTLAVHIFDANTKQLLWRAAESDSLSRNSEKNTSKLAKDVEEMFKNFPPGRK